MLTTLALALTLPIAVIGSHDGLAPEENNTIVSATAVSTTAVSPTAVVDSLADIPQGHFRRRGHRRHRSGGSCTPTPEPATLSLMGIAGLGLAFSRKRKKKV